MSPSKLHDCAVCEKQTDQRCGGCASDFTCSFFCSRECQKLIWHTHKVICKAGGAFTVPPLSPEEVAAVTHWEDDLIVTGPGIQLKTPLQSLKELGWYKGSWENLMRQMSNFALSTLSPEAHVAILTFLRKLLVSDKKTGGSTSALTPWQLLANACTPVIQQPGGGGPGPIFSAALSRSKPLLEQAAILYTFLASTYHTTPTPDQFPLFRLAHERTIKALAALDMPPQRREQMEETSSAMVSRSTGSRPG
ncbi:hypothetical protein JCM10213_007243 [Rhodosporidiobolus nylandii]